MRIGIIAMARSGGRNLGEWISYELGIEFIHEPLPNGSNTNGKNIVVKWLINDWERLDTKPEMDKWIGLVRMDSRDCAISHLKAQQSGDWHKPYTLTNEWISEREEDIKALMESNTEWNTKVSTQIKELELIVSYEGIYDSGKDIKRLMDYIGIQTAPYSHMLDKSNRLRNPKPKVKTLI